MNNGDEKFQQRWEFRRRDDDGSDSSTDDDSKSNNHHSSIGKPKINTSSLVLHQNLEEATPPHHTPIIHLDEEDHQKLDPDSCVRLPKKKTNPRNKKNIAKNKSKKCPNNEDKNPRKRKNLNNADKEAVMFDDLKTFSSSLIDELKVARETMFRHMRDEMGTLVPHQSMIKKNVTNRRSKKTPNVGGNKYGVKPQNRTGTPSKRTKKNVKEKTTSDPSKIPKAIKTPAKHDQVVENEPKTKDPREHGKSRPLPNKSPSIFANGSDKVVSSTCLTIPSLHVIPKPQLEIRRNTSLPSGDRSSASVLEVGNFTNATSRYPHEIPSLFQPEQQLGSFSCITNASNSGLRFPVPMNHGLDRGKFGLRMNENMRYPEFSQGVLTTSMNSSSYRSDGEFGSLKLQDLKESQRYMADFRTSSKQF